MPDFLELSKRLTSPAMWRWSYTQGSGTMASGAGHWSAAELHFTAALKGAEEANLNPACRLKSMQCLAITYRNQGHLDKAQEVCDAALALLNKIAAQSVSSKTPGQSKTHRRSKTDMPAMVQKDQQRYQAQFLNLLGSVRMLDDRPDDARLLYERALQIEREYYGDDHPSVTTVRDNLTGLAVMQNDLAKAESLARSSLTSTEKIMGSNHINVALPLQNLAYILTLQESFEEAEILYKRSLAILDGSQNHSVAGEFFAPKRFAEDDMRWRFNSMYAQGLGAKNPVLMLTIDGLAELYARQKRFDEAEPLYQRVLALQEASHGPNHPNVAGALEHYATMLNDCNRAADAAPLEERAKNIRQVWSV